MPDTVATPSPTYERQEQRRKLAGCGVGELGDLQEKVMALDLIEAFKDENMNPVRLDREPDGGLTICKITNERDYWVTLSRESAVRLRDALNRALPDPPARPQLYRLSMAIAHAATLAYIEQETGQCQTR